MFASSVQSASFDGIVEFSHATVVSMPSGAPGVEIGWRPGENYAAHSIESNFGEFAVLVTDGPPQGIPTR